jgi:hypothetical protein
VAVAHDAADVRADVVGEAHVQEVQGSGVARLGPRDRAPDELGLVSLILRASEPSGRSVRCLDRIEFAVVRQRIPHGC